MYTRDRALQRRRNQVGFGRLCKWLGGGDKEYAESLGSSTRQSEKDMEDKIMGMCGGWLGGTMCNWKLSTQY